MEGGGDGGRGHRRGRSSRARHSVHAPVTGLPGLLPVDTHRLDPQANPANTGSEVGLQPNSSLPESAREGPAVCGEANPIQHSVQHYYPYLRCVPAVSAALPLSPVYTVCTCSITLTSSVPAVVTDCSHRYLLATCPLRRCCCVPHSAVVRDGAMSPCSANPRHSQL